MLTEEGSRERMWGKYPSLRKRWRTSASLTPIMAQRQYQTTCSMQWSALLQSQFSSASILKIS
jgi:hypothetical protein